MCISKNPRINLAALARRIAAVPAMRSAKRALVASQWPAVANAYWRVLQIDPSRAEIRVQYGHALKEAGDFAQAVCAHGGAINANLSCAEAWLMRAGLLASIGEHDQFLVAVDEMLIHLPQEAIAAEHHEQYVAALTLRGELLLKRLASSDRGDRATDHRKAEESFKLATAILPEDERLQRLLFRARRVTRAVAARDKPTLVDSIRYLNVGTTSLCNASCIHCPTGKP